MQGVESLMAGDDKFVILPTGNGMCSCPDSF